METLVMLALLTVIIAIHEYGHFLYMRRNGVEVKVFSVGFGPVLWSAALPKGGVFKLCLIPLGGYVMPATEGDRAIEAASPGAKFRIYMAGMFFNTLSAAVVLSVVCVLKGGTPTLIAPYRDALSALGWFAPVVGSFALCFALWFLTPYLFVKAVASGLGAFLHGVSGPVGILGSGAAAIAAAPTATDAVFGLCMQFVMISVSIAGFNFLPLVPLDGGKVFELGLQAVTGAKSSRVISLYRTISLLIVLGVLVPLALFGDLIKRFVGQ